MENVKRINKFLEQKYGKALDNKPKFRVAWSDSMTEVRRGLHSPLAIHEEIKRVPKYAFVSERWVLEVNTLAFPAVFASAIKHAKDVVMDGDGFEPLRVFQTRKGDYLKPDLEVCELICNKWIELVNRPEGQRLTEKKASYDDVKKMKEESDKFFEILNGDDSTLIHQLRDGEAVLLPGKEFS